MHGYLDAVVIFTVSYFIFGACTHPYTYNMYILPGLTISATDCISINKCSNCCILKLLLVDNMAASTPFFTASCLLHGIRTNFLAHTCKPPYTHTAAPTNSHALLHQIVTSHFDSIPHKHPSLDIRHSLYIIL